MKKIMMLLTALGIVLMMATFAFAGDKMIIFLKNGKQQSIDVSAIQKVEFQAGATSGSTAISSGSGYRVISKNSGKCMDVSGNEMGNAANVHQWDCHGGNNQLWYVTANGQGNYTFKAAHSGRCLDVSGVSTATGANVYQWDCHGGDNQAWALIPQGGGYYMITAKHSGKCLDVAGVSRDNGANIYQWDCHGGDNQLWKLQ
jgi:alpha-amylase